MKTKKRTGRERRVSVRMLLAENLRMCMEEHPPYRTQKALAAEAGVSQSHISLMLRPTKHKTAVTIETVEKVAAVFGLDAWQLIIDAETYAAEGSADLKRDLQRVKASPQGQKAKLRTT